MRQFVFEMFALCNSTGDNEYISTSAAILSLAHCLTLMNTDGAREEKCTLNFNRYVGLDNIYITLQFIIAVAKTGN